MLRDELYNILGTLGKLPSAEETIKAGVKRKLAVSQGRYESRISEDVEYLLFRNGLKVLKALSKENKK